jgi:hypothetical protein
VQATAGPRCFTGPDALDPPCLTAIVGTMAESMTTDELRELLLRLDKTGYPQEGEPETKLLRLAVALNTWDYPCVARVECGYMVQDASHVGEIEFLVSTSRGTQFVKVRASAWGDLVTFMDTDGAIDAKREQELRTIFREQGYVYVPHKLLQEEYPGEHLETWFRRFFDW